MPPRPLQASSDVDRVVDALRSYATELRKNPPDSKLVSLAWDGFRAAFGSGLSDDPDVSTDGSVPPLADRPGLTAILRASAELTDGTRDLLYDLLELHNAVVCAIRQTERGEIADEKPLREARTTLRAILNSVVPHRAVAAETGADANQETAPTKAWKLKASTTNGDARTKLIAALVLHHKYCNGSCESYEPISGNGLQRLAGVGSTSTSHAFIKDVFGGQGEYNTLCAQRSPLLAFKLKLLDGPSTEADFKPLIEHAIEADRALREE